MESTSRLILMSYGFAVLTTFVATWARISLSNVLENRMPFGLYFLSLVLTLWIAGVGPGLLSFLLGILAATLWIIAPPNGLLLTHPADQISLAIYAVVGGAAIMMSFRADRKQVAVSVQSAANAELTKQLRMANQQKDNWLALLAHELRNPLAPIRSGIDLLDREPHDAEKCRKIRLRMRRQTEQLVRIVEDLLDVSRYTRGQLHLDCQPVDLRTIVQQAVEMTAQFIAEKGHDLKQVKCNQSLFVNGDSARLVQVVSNLLSNAAKYTPRGGHIQVLLDGDPELAKVSIVDNGIGIAKDFQESAFELFAQAHSARNRDQQGLGIGLALVRSVVEMHHGFVTLHSEGPGRGSRFSITLPRLDASTEVPAQPAKPRRDANALEGKTVLLIDDNQDAVDTLAALLTMDGFRTFTAYNGPSGLEAMADVRPDFILLDIGMPGMDGYEVVSRIRKESANPRPVVIATSGWGSEADRKRALDAGFDAELVKPIDYQDLSALLLNSVRWNDATVDGAEFQASQPLADHEGVSPKT